MLDVDRFCATHPSLFHMAHPEAWPSIQRHGLLSTSELYRLLGLSEPQKLQARQQRARKSVPLPYGSDETIYIRDQSVLIHSKLRSVLDADLSVDDWLDTLDERVFFWAQQKSLLGLLGARLYRNHPQLVLEIDTRRLFDLYLDRIELADINTGSTLFTPPTRGRKTFQPVADYTRYKQRDIVEVTVRHRVPDLQQFLLRATLYHPTGHKQPLL